MENFELNALFPTDSKYVFLVGAGCSVDPPSCLPSGRQTIKDLIRYMCVDSEINKILSLDQLRFEQLVEIIQDIVDPTLKIIEYYEQCDNPNPQHFFLAEMMKQGHYVMTTNFDHLIENALLDSGIAKEMIFPVITKEDYEKYSDPENLSEEKKYFIYKIHGSPTNYITGEDTKESLITTIKALGAGKIGESVFQLEPHKRPFIDHITKGRRLVIIGYSGSDDFDIIPTLGLLSQVTHILWIEHSNGKNFVNIDPISNKTSITQGDKIGQILHEIQRMDYHTQIYRIHGHTSIILSTIFKLRENYFKNSFNQSLNDYLSHMNILLDEIEKYLVSYKIYEVLSMIVDAERCILNASNISEKFPNTRYTSIIFNNLGILRYLQGDIAQALLFYKKALEIDWHLRDLPKIAIRLSNISSLLIQKEDLAQALIYYKQAYGIANFLNDDQIKAYILNNIGIILIERKAQNLTLFEGKQDLLIENPLFEDSIFDEQNFEAEDSDIFIRLSSLPNRREDLFLAFACFERACALAERYGDLKLKATTLSNIGLVFKRMKNNDQSIKYFQDALRINTQLGNLRGKAECLNNIGYVFNLKGESMQALSFFQEALYILEKIGVGESYEAEYIRENIKFLKEHFL